MQNYISDIEKLYDERNYYKYLEKLKELKKKYTIIIVTSGMQKDTVFTHEMADALQDTFDLSMNLYRCVQYPYISIIEKDQVKECFFGPGAEKTAINVEVSLKLWHLKISSYFNTENDCDAVIKIFGEERAVKTGKGGLYIMVLHRERRIILDSCAFSFGDDKKIECNHLMDGFTNYQKQNPGVSLLFYLRPELVWQGMPYSNGERYLIEKSFNIVDLLKQSSDVWPEEFALFKEFDTIEEIQEVLSPRNSYYDYYGVRKLEDFESKYVNIKAGIRITHGQPEEYTKAIYILGPCTVYGVGVADEHTIPSWIQQRINLEHDEKIAVFNYGYFFSGVVNSLEEQVKILYSLPVKDGDIVVILPDGNYLAGFPIYDLQQASKRPHDYGEVYIDSYSHYSSSGNRLVADALYEYLQNNGYFDSSKNLNAEPKDKNMYLSKMAPAENEYLTGYKSILCDFYNETLKEHSCIGSVVMNCNPFTRGHRYLVEQALQQCDYLIIFLVQEDKSVYSFDDRFDMVTAGIADLKNVVVIPSGQFILSSKTFSEYFNKENMQNRIIDTSYDITIFANEIAPCVHLSKRFVGEEPFDNITRQYNETMKRILPRYGIDVVEIKRKQIENSEEVISASKVRALLQKKQYEEVLKLVPDTTFQYLMKMEGRI